MRRGIDPKSLTCKHFILDLPELGGAALAGFC